MIPFGLSASSFLTDNESFLNTRQPCFKNRTA